MYPEFIILNLAPDVIEFKEIINSLSFGKEVNEQFIIQHIFYYIVELDNGYNGVLEYVTIAQEIYSDKATEKEIEEYGEAIRQLGIAILNMVYRYGMYDREGVVWYQFYQMIMNDVVVRRVKDYIN